MLKSLVLIKLAEDMLSPPAPPLPRLLDQGLSLCHNMRKVIKV